MLRSAVAQSGREVAETGGPDRLDVAALDGTTVEAGIGLAVGNPDGVELLPAVVGVAAVAQPIAARGRRARTAPDATSVTMPRRPRTARFVALGALPTPVTVIQRYRA
jgi:hypothetical protein